MLRPLPVLKNYSWVPGDFCRQKEPRKSLLRSLLFQNLFKLALFQPDRPSLVASFVSWVKRRKRLK